MIGFLGYFFWSIYCLKKLEKHISHKTVLFYLVIIQFTTHIDTVYGFFVGSVFSLPLLLLHIFGIISGYLFVQIQNKLKILPFSLCILFSIFMFFEGWDYWIHRINFGTFTGKVHAYNLPTKFEALNEQKNLIEENDLNNKIILLDFWTTTCGLCFKKFPKLQSIYDKYKDDSQVMILAVNSPIEEDKPNQAFEMIRERNLTFPVVVTKDEDLAEKFAVKGYPTTFVINQNKQIVYKGDIEGAIRMVDELREPK
ncbi:MAG: TlpA family protein disulfide reductase [Pyrinomonadaceae bacterium]|nr:TlpA family protein disulfide reductase [Pyrinomonadaceae bacterium]